MAYFIDGSNIVIRVKDFDIEHILECGQCFRFYKLSDKHYRVIAHGSILDVTQDNHEVTLHNTSEAMYQSIWHTYFDLDRDYGHIKASLSDMDQHLNRAVTAKGGIRLIQQDTWETLISFIISQNKHITHIKKLIEDLSQAYGSYIDTVDGKAYYSFPTPNALSEATEQELRDLKVGFRAPYIVDAVKKVLDQEVDIGGLLTLPIEEAKKELMKIKGVGPKVADCVLLFGARRYEVFPVDVWVKRVMEYYYFEKDTKIGDIHGFAVESFGPLAGFAQQYLFYYARDFQIGKKK